MTKQIDVRVVEGILYGLYKALYKIAGSSASAVMRQAAPDILLELNKIGVDFSCVDNVAKLESKLGDTMTTTGMCDSFKLDMDGNKLKAEIHNCSFAELTAQLKDEGIPPFGCPFAALTIAIAEKNLGKKARLADLHPVEGGDPGDTYLEVELFD